MTNVKGTSTWGCSHNEGIAFEEHDSPPYPSICAEDHTGIWLNTKTGSMSGTKISNEVSSGPELSYLCGSLTFLACDQCWYELS